MNLYSALSLAFMYVFLLIFLPLRTIEKLWCNLQFERTWDMIMKYQTSIGICCIKLQGSQVGGEPSSPLMSYLNWMWAGNFWRYCCSVPSYLECTTCQSCLHWNFCPRLLPRLLHIHFVWLPPWLLALHHYLSLPAVQANSTCVQFHAIFQKLCQWHAHFSHGCANGAQIFLTCSCMMISFFITFYTLWKPLSTFIRRNKTHNQFLSSSWGCRVPQSRNSDI